MLAATAMAYGRILFQDGEREMAEPYLREALRRFRASPKPQGVYFVLAADFLFQITRGREDPASLLETDDLLREMIQTARSFWDVDTLAGTQKYYAGRMVDRGKFVDALGAVVDAYQALVDAGRPADERDSLRGDLIEISFQVSLQPDRASEAYALARDAVELALADEPDNLLMSAALVVVLYRQGEYALAAETLGMIREPLSRSTEPAAKKITPIVLAFGALTHARLGDDAVARSELEELRASYGKYLRGSAQGAAMLREIEDLIEHSPSSSEDD
jgi:tetratricopeptide (TPR) repeat protein